MRPFLLSFLATLAFDFAGYWLHRSLHVLPWPWWLRAHAAHHYEAYPPERFLQDGPYRATGDLRRFLLALAPAALAIGLLFPIGDAVLLLESLAVYSFLNEYLHDAFHVRGHRLERFSWFVRLRAIHMRHHLDVRANFGIYTFLWDRAFGTYAL